MVNGLWFICKSCPSLVDPTMCALEIWGQGDQPSPQTQEDYDDADDRDI